MKAPAGEHSSTGVFFMLIRTSEENHYHSSIDGAETLRYLMVEHELNQTNLPEVGSQGVISEILNGRRKLSTRQIGLLAKRFAVLPAVFF